MGKGNQTYGTMHHRFGKTWRDSKVRATLHQNMADRSAERILVGLGVDPKMLEKLDIEPYRVPNTRQLVGTWEKRFRHTNEELQERERLNALLTQYFMMKRQGKELADVPFMKWLAQFA